MKIRFAFVLSSVTALALAGCAAYTSGPSASAKLEPTRGNTTAGTVTFVQTGDGVQVSGESLMADLSLCKSNGALPALMVEFRQFKDWLQVTPWLFIVKRHCLKVPTFVWWML